MPSCPTAPAAPRPLELLLVMAAATAYALLVYYLPQAGLAIHSDVSWIYRLQVADPAEIGPVPYGLAAFGGAPMSLAEACAAHYAAFGRLNCLDIASFRAIAALAGGDTDLWLLIYLATGLVMLGLLYWLMRRLGLPVALAVLLLAGALVAPQELWLGYRTSEPRNAVALLLGLVALLTLPARWRNPAAALALAVAVQLKEPMVAYWPFVWLVALGVEMREAGGLRNLLAERRRLWRATWPHALAGVLVLGYMYAVTQLVGNRFSYAFLATGGYPDLGLFLDRYWNGLVPALLEGQFLAAFGLLLAVLVVAVVRDADKRRAALDGWRDPVILTTILGALLAIVAHGAFYYLTRRLIGDTRYVNPANLAMLLGLAAALAPLARAAGVAAARLAVLACLVAVGWYVLRVQASDAASDALYLVVGTAAAAIPFVASLAAGRGSARRRLPSALLNAALGALLVLALGPYMRQSLHAAGQARADMQTWTAVQAAVAETPPEATIRLATDTPLMIETAWGLQTEMLFAGRGDLTFFMEPLDTSFYERESGVVRAAVEAFNAERPEPQTGKDFTLLMDRGGRGGEPAADARSTLEWAALLLADPARFYRAGYVEGRNGYLRFTWETPPPGT